MHGELKADYIWSSNVYNLMDEHVNVNLIMNLEYVDRIDTSGIIFLMNLNHRISQCDNSFVLYGLGNHIIQMLRATKTENIFKIASNAKMATKMLEMHP